MRPALRTLDLTGHMIFVHAHCEAPCLCMSTCDRNFKRTAMMMISKPADGTDSMV